MTRADVDLSKVHSTHSCWNNVDHCWVHITRDAELIQEMPSMIVQELSRYGIYVNLLPNHWSWNESLLILDHEVNIFDFSNLQKFTQIIPCVHGETSLCENVSELCFRVNVFDPYAVVSVYSFKQWININPLCSLHVSHCWSSYFHTHLDHCIEVFHDQQLCSVRYFGYVAWHIINV